MRRVLSYATRPGEHCGSTAMRSLLRHYPGLDLSEAMVFGLGSGLDCLVIETGIDLMPLMAFGRGPTMERDCASALGVDYEERTEPDDQRAWSVVRDEVAAGRPTMLAGDPLYLDYHPANAHFPLHRFVLVGFDDAEATAWVIDRPWTDAKACSYKELAASRNPKDWPVSAVNLWGRFGDAPLTRTLRDACETALRRTVERMHGRDASVVDATRANGGALARRITTGLEAIRCLRDQLLALSTRPHAHVHALELSHIFERRGTGGGNFRRLYAAFLAEAASLAPELVPGESVEAAGSAAAGWTRLAALLHEVGQRQHDDWTGCADVLDAIYDAEATMTAGLERQLSSAVAPR